MATSDAFLAPLAVGAVEVTGEDRGSYLHAVLSQRVAGMAPGTVAGALELDAQGRPLAMMDVAVLDERILLLTADPGLAQDVASRLGSRTFLKDARFAVLDVVGRALRGEGAGELLAAVSAEVAPRAVVEEDGAVVVGRDGGADVVGAADAVDKLAGRLIEAGAEPVDADALEAWRVAAGVPAWGREVRPPHLPEESGVLATHVHLDKGCYPGQEAVARMWMLGRPRRRLARVTLVGAVDAGWAWGSGRGRAEVTSAVSTDGGRVGLAYVPASAAPGDRFGDDDAAVVVSGFVGEGLEVPGHDPGVTRRRDRRG